MLVYQETVLKSILQQIIAWQTTHNSIIYLAKNHLHVVNLVTSDTQSKSIRSETIIKISTDHNNLIALLYADQCLQIRKINPLTEPIHIYQKVLYDKSKGKPLFKWHMKQLYAVYEDKIYQFGHLQPFYTLPELYVDQLIINVAFSQLSEDRIILSLHLTTIIIFSIMSLPITLLDIPDVTSLINISHPLQIKAKRQYLILLVAHRWLKVYDFLNLKIIVQLDLKTNPNQTVEIKTDTFNEYLVLSFMVNSKVVRNNLLKVNTDYYYGSTFKYQQPFFHYNEQLGLVEDFCLFFGQNQQISNIQHNSLGICYFKKKQLIIGSIIIPIDYKTKISMIKTDDTQLPYWGKAISSILQPIQKNRQPRPIVYNPHDRICRLKLTKSLSSDSDIQIMNNNNSEDNLTQKDQNQLIERYLNENSFGINNEGFLKELDSNQKSAKEQKTEDYLNSVSSVCLTQHNSQDSRIEKTKQLCDQLYMNHESSSQQAEQSSENDYHLQDDIQFRILEHRIRSCFKPMHQNLEQLQNKMYSIESKIKAKLQKFKSNIITSQDQKFLNCQEMTQKCFSSIIPKITLQINHTLQTYETIMKQVDANNNQHFKQLQIQFKKSIQNQLQINQFSQIQYSGADNNQDNKLQ